MSRTRTRTSKPAAKTQAKRTAGTRSRRPITADRCWQISNNVSEEYVDLGQTSFATKVELCEAIIGIRNHYDAVLRRKDQALDDVTYMAAHAELAKLGIDAGFSFDWCKDKGDVLPRIMNRAIKGRRYGAEETGAEVVKA